MTEPENSSDSVVISMEELNKRKTIAQSSFTRTYNCLSKLVDSKSPDAAIHKVLEELESRYKVLEERCDAIQMSSDPDSQVEDLLTGKYELLNDIRAKVHGTKAKPSESVSTDGHDRTEELIKSFKASLTMPKPETKKFSGDPCTFAEYISYVETYVEPNVSDSKQCLAILVDTCTGKARDSIAYLLQCSDSTEAYGRAKDVLKEMFGRKHQIVRAVMEECANGPNIGPSDFNNLRSLVISMRKAETTLTEYGSAEELVSTDKLVKVFRRLPKPIQGRWSDKLFELQEKGQKPSLSHMRQLVESYIKSRDNEYSTATTSGKPANIQTNQRAGKPVYSIGTVKVECKFCKGGHYLNQCPEFLQLTLKSRYEFVSQKSLCRNCLHPGHIATKCKRKGMCKQCTGKHNHVLHDHVFQTECQSIQNVSSNVNPESDTVLNVTKGDEENSVAGISCVNVFVEGSGAMFKCKAIVDQKSSVNLCSERLAKKLGLPSTQYKTTFNVATGNYVVQGRKISCTNVYSNDMQKNVKVNDIFTVKQIPVSMSSVFKDSDIHGVEHLKGIEIPMCSDSDQIDLLIGSGVPKAFHQYEQRKGSDGQIYAVRLTLGWDLVGPKKVGKNGQFCGMLTEPNVFLIDRSPVSTDTIPFHLDRVFGQDFNDCSLFSSKLGPSIEDTHALQLAKSSMTTTDGKFCVGIPWKQDPANLPSNKEIALRRLNGLSKKFHNDPQLFAAYSSEMKKFIDSDFIETGRSNDSELCHYIPHHPVWHPRKGSLRIVWDCAVSLNDFIYEGPDLLNQLTDVLIRFRRFKYAVTSDIRKMYLNVKVPPKDRGALRILWWPDNDMSKAPTEYRATVHIYGAKSSGFIANLCVHHLAEGSEDRVLSDVLKKDLYVDDQASSLQHEDEAISLVSDLSALLSKGGFHLTKFVSNSKAVINSIPEVDRGLDQSESNHSILGLKWNVQTDELGIPCSIPDDSQVPTRRSLLSMAAKVYDPLGIVSPVLLPVKAMLQTKTKLGWDDSDPEIASCLQEFMAGLNLVSKFSVPRCYKPDSDSFDKPKHVSIHGFSDASNVGYSAVVYLRQVSTSGQVACSFVTGKSRVAPKLKGQVSAATIPKLELNAAALLTKLVDNVKTCIDIQINDTVYWCDSQAVLSCLSATDKRFPVYWTNRLALILGMSNSEQWRYVPTKCNPADIGSRGIHSKEFSKKIQTWISGPAFLTLPPERWPEQTDAKCPSHVFLTDTCQTPHPPGEKHACLLTRLVEHYSELQRLLNVTVRLMHFSKSVLRKRQKSMSQSNGNESHYKQEAMLALIRHEQNSLPVEHLKRLRPFLDSRGIYRVNGRLSNMSHLSYDERFPIILPKKSNLTKLIISEEHKLSAHMGPNYVLTRLRANFWVIGGKSAVRNVISGCRLCKEKNARPLQQVMCPLPEERGTPSFPFQHVGLDYFGPFYCKVRRQRFKRYGCVFVCLATRAVHIECVNSLETNAFLCALTRFIARRGRPEKVYSDNGTNFRGAQEELGNAIASLDDHAGKYAESKGFTWHFHPPHGSHHGGHYERLIRSIREILFGITNEQEMSEDNLNTFLCEAERILNDRPLTTISDDPDDQTPITPNLILLLHGNVCKPLFESENAPKAYHRQAQFLADLFWKRWLKEYVPSLQLRQKWFLPQRNLMVGDLVLMCGEGHPRGHWPIAKVVDVSKDIDGCVRKVTVKDKNGLKVRPITKLALLESAK